MKFKYTAIDIKSGKTVSDTTVAERPAEVIAWIKSQDMLPVKVIELKTLKTRILRDSLLNKGRVKGKELVVFTRQMAAMVDAGLILTEALDIALKGINNSYFHKIIYRIREDVKAGGDFSSALERHSAIFPHVYIAIVKAGEATGQLAEMLQSLARYMEADERLRQKVKSSLSYPMFVLGFAVVIVITIVVFLIPQFKSLFEQFHAELPLLTRMVIAVSDFMIHQALWAVLGLIGFIVAFHFLMKSHDFKRFVDVMKLKIPIIGEQVIQKALLARFCRTFSILLRSGVSLERSLNICEEVANHIPLEEAINKVNIRVVGGSSIAEELKAHKIFPALVSRMVAAGERSGQIHDMLGRTAQYYEEELETTLTNLTSLLEPVLIVSVGSIVLVVVLALYLPIFRLSSIMR
jgi:type IV pilus assembly protein PilC